MPASDSEPARDHEKRSGRRPGRPPHGPVGGLGRTAKRTLAEFKADELTDSAAALTYYGVLSVFPALITLVSVVSLVADPKTIVEKGTDLVSRIGPDSAVRTFKGPIDSLASGGGAGLALVLGVLAALWTASGYVGAFMRASNRVYEVEEGRSALVLRLFQMLVTLVLILLQAVVLLVLVVSGPVARDAGSALGLGGTAVTVWNIAKWPVLVIILVITFCVLFYASPNARLATLTSVIPGAVIALAAWLVASLAFAFYVAEFGSYDKTYGTLAGIIVFLVWLWVTNVALLFGAEFNAELERGRRLAAGRPGAERELQMEERSARKRSKRSRAA